MMSVPPTEPIQKECVNSAEELTMEIRVLDLYEKRK